MPYDAEENIQFQWPFYIGEMRAHAQWHAAFFIKFLKLSSWESDEWLLRQSNDMFEKYERLKLF